MLLGLRSTVMGHRVLTAAVLATLALVAAGLLTWRHAGAFAATQVQVQWSPYCSPGVATQVEVDPGSREKEPAFRSKPGWECVIEISLFNGSDRTIHVSRIEASHLGSGGRSEIVGFSTDDATIRDAGPPEYDFEVGHRDAVYDVSRDLPPRTETTIQLKVGWRPEGCNSAGQFRLGTWPAVVFNTLGRTFEARPEQNLVLVTYDDAHDTKYDEPGQQCGFPLTARRKDQTSATTPARD